MTANRSPNSTSARRLHYLLGLVVGLPLLAWSISGFFLAIPPGVVAGEPYSVIEPQRVRLTPAQASQAVDLQLGRAFEPTSISLEQRGNKVTYALFGQGGAYLVDAESGEVRRQPPPSRTTRWIRHAHFFNFAGSWRTRLLLLLSFLSACLVGSGLWLAGRRWGRTGL